VSGKDVFLSVSFVTEVLPDFAEGTTVAAVPCNDVVVEDDVGDEPGDDAAGVPCKDVVVEDDVGDEPGDDAAGVPCNDVVVEDDVGDEPGDDAAGVPLTVFDAAESPMAFTALIVTEYAVPFVRPVLVNGLVVDAGESAV
jgi:hypothetical protein